MPRLFSNGPSKDHVINPILRLLGSAADAYLAAPYFTHETPILDAALKGVNIRLIVGLNPSTSPAALVKILGVPNLQI